MRYFIDGVLIVEGKGDSSYLSSFIDAMYVCTNGYDIKEQDIDFLKHVSTQKKVIILTDPDDAGKKIRERLNKLLPFAINVEVSYESCHKNHKHGIAECDKETIITALKEHFSKQKPQPYNEYLFLMNGNDSLLREEICAKFHLGKCNFKTMIKRLNFLNIKEKETKKVMDEYYGNK